MSHEADIGAGLILIGKGLSGLQKDRAEMLAALKLTLPKMRRDNDDPEGINWERELAAIDAAIAKAEEASK